MVYFLPCLFCVFSLSICASLGLSLAVARLLSQPPSSASLSGSRDPWPASSRSPLFHSEGPTARPCILAARQPTLCPAPRLARLWASLFAPRSPRATCPCPRHHRWHTHTDLHLTLLVCARPVGITYLESAWRRRSATQDEHGQHSPHTQHSQTHTRLPVAHWIVSQGAHRAGSTVCRVRVRVTCPVSLFLWLHTAAGRRCPLLNGHSHHGWRHPPCQHPLLLSTPFSLYAYSLSFMRTSSPLGPWHARVYCLVQSHAQPCPPTSLCSFSSRRSGRHGIPLRGSARV